MIEVEPFEHLGADVRIDDLASLGDDETETLVDLFRAHGVLRIRDQLLLDDELLEVASRFGTGAPRLDVASWPGPELSPLAWRMVDQRLPPAEIALSLIRRAPIEGVSIEVLSTANAFDRLDTASRSLLETIRIQHPEADRAMPFAIRDGATGRPTMLFDPSQPFEVEGVEGVDADVLGATLVAHATEDETGQRIDLDSGDLLIVAARAHWIRVVPTRAADEARRVDVFVPGLPPQPAVIDRRELTFAERAGATIAGGVIAAAMTGIAEVLDPERLRQDIEIVSEAPEPEPLTELDFGDLPPLD